MSRSTREILKALADHLEEASLYAAVKGLRLSSNSARIGQLSRIASDELCEQYLMICQEEGSVDAHGVPKISDWDGSRALEEDTPYDTPKVNVRRYGDG